MLYGVFTALVILTVVLLAMSAWTNQIYYTTQRGEVSSTQDLQYINDPLVGNITIGTYPAMYESVPTYIFFNISLHVLGHTPMDLAINRIEATFTPANDPDSEVSVTGLYSSIPYLEVANASHVMIQGTIEIVPIIVAGWENVCLGMGIEYALFNHSLTKPNSWGGTDGALFMIPITVIPAIFRPEGWTNAVGAVLSLWGVVIICSLYIRSRYP